MALLRLPLGAAVAAPARRTIAGTALACSLVLLSAGCESGESASPSHSGPRETAAEGRYVAFHYDARLVAVGGEARRADPFDSTRGGEPFVAKLGKTPLLPGLLNGLLGMREGERRKITIPPDQGYGALGKPPVPPDATLEYDVELVDVFMLLPSGVHVRVVKEGAGPVPQEGDRVVVNHRAWLLETGREVASSKALGRALEFQVGKGLAIPALEEALRTMKSGSRWILAIPPEQGYGPHGRVPHLFPGHELVMDVELAGIRPR